MCFVYDLNNAMTKRESKFEENNSTGCSILWHSISTFPLLKHTKKMVDIYVRCHI